MGRASPSATSRRPGRPALDAIDAQERRYFELLGEAASWTLVGTAVTVTSSDGATLVFGDDTAPTDDLPLVGSWPLATIDGEAPPPGMSVVLDIHDDGTLSGQACNSYLRATPASAAGDLSVDAIAATRMSCGDAADAFEASLSGRPAGRDPVVRAGRAAAPVGQRRAGVRGGRRSGRDPHGPGVAAHGHRRGPVDAGLGIGVSFGEDGMATGSGGCNRFTGPYTAEGDSLSVGPLASTRMSCGVTTDDLETSYLNALEAAVGFVISGQDLVISTSTDQTLEFSTAVGPVATASPAPTARATTAPEATPAVGAGDILGTWKMTSYVNQPLPGNMLAIDITFAPDGTFSGFGGCNDYTGRWALDGTRLTISGFESASSGTCDQLTQGLETGYFSLLPFLDTAEVRPDGSLSLVSALGGNQGFVFQRAG
ncbi:MAG: META domain-containing protein [Chloroflexota bacterium]